MTILVISVAIAAFVGAASLTIKISQTYPLAKEFDNLWFDKDCQCALHK